MYTQVFPSFPPFLLYSVARKEKDDKSWKLACHREGRKLCTHVWAKGEEHSRVKKNSNKSLNLEKEAPCPVPPAAMQTCPLQLTAKYSFLKDPFTICLCFNCYRAGIYFSSLPLKGLLSVHISRVSLSFLSHPQLYIWAFSAFHSYN